MKTKIFALIGVIILGSAIISKLALANSNQNQRNVMREQISRVLTNYRSIRIIPNPIRKEQISFNYGNLAKKVRPQLVAPQLDDPNNPLLLNGEPVHLRYYFDTDPLALDQSFNPHQRQLIIYPVSAYRKMLTGASLQQFNHRINQLKQLIKSNSIIEDQTIPTLPSINGTQDTRLELKKLNFKSGSGIRFITSYTLDPQLTNDQEPFYTFQGLTHDGQYYVSLYYPISPLTKTTDSDKNFYLDLINSFYHPDDPVSNFPNSSSEHYQPDLSQIDQMIESLKIKPKSKPW